MSTLQEKIQFLYPDEAAKVYTRLESLMYQYKSKLPKKETPQTFFSEKDAILITYADHIQEHGVPTLQTMQKFLKEFVKGLVNKVHFLPFYPYSSDDGFSVIDYYKIKDEFGTWNDVHEVAKDFGLMFDLVINHASSKSEWFKKFLESDEKYKDFFIAFDENVDVSKVFRPRTHPLLTKFETKNGLKYVWTTFSEDQIDLNFANPEVFLEMMNVLLFYVEQGAEVIRLDAITYLWKELGTNCIHLPKTHMVAKAMRQILEEVAPYVWIITETNVPHKENISYFGNGLDEAHLVYNFTLPPLLLYSFLNGNATTLTQWASTLELPSNKTAFFNFTASHDGIGVTPLKNIIPDEEIQKLADYVLKNGGKVNYRTVTGMPPQPYEMNVVYLSAIGSPEKYLASQAIQIALRGVPAIYLNSLVGEENWTEGVEQLGYNRAINRRKFDYEKLKKELNEAGTTKHLIYTNYKHLLQTRINEPLFSPHTTQKILTLKPEVFAILRNKEEQSLLALTNVSDKEIAIDNNALSHILYKTQAKDLLTNQLFDLSSANNFILKPYQTVWLK